MHSFTYDATIIFETIFPQSHHHHHDTNTNSDDSHDISLFYAEFIATQSLRN